MARISQRCGFLSRSNIFKLCFSAAAPPDVRKPYALPETERNFYELCPPDSSAKNYRQLTQIALLLRCGGA